MARSDEEKLFLARYTEVVHERLLSVLKACAAPAELMIGALALALARVVVTAGIRNHEEVLRMVHHEIETARARYAVETGRWVQ